MAPRNITLEFIDLLKKNGAYAQGLTKTTLSQDLAGLASGGIARVINPLARFHSLVRTGGPWDFKSNWLKKDEYVEITGVTHKRDVPGNFHYGFTGAAIGIRNWLLFKAAGLEQLKQGTSSPDFECTDFDDPRDHEYIRLGIKLYNDVGLKISESNLKVMLSQFRPVKCGSN